MNINKINYQRIGDYLLPCIALSDPIDVPPLGQYGVMHKEYLRTEKPALYTTLLLTERLYPLYREVIEATTMDINKFTERKWLKKILRAEILKSWLLSLRGAYGIHFVDDHSSHMVKCFENTR